MSGLYLVLRRAGVLYALPAAAVSELRQGAGGVGLRFAGAVVVADGVAGLARDLPCRGAGRVWRRFLPPGGTALALWQHQPVLVLAASGALPTPLALRPVADIAPFPGKDTGA